MKAAIAAGRTVLKLAVVRWAPEVVKCCLTAQKARGPQVWATFNELLATLRCSGPSFWASNHEGRLPRGPIKSP